MLFVQEGFTFRNFLMDALAIFVFIVWFWLLITVASDLFRRHDISGWVKALWVIVLVVAPYIGVFAYLIFQGRGMAERNAIHDGDSRRLWVAGRHGRYTVRLTAGIGQQRHGLGGMRPLPLSNVLSRCA